MNKYLYDENHHIVDQEDRSLSEVREWKEQCRQEMEQFSPEEYLAHLKQTIEQLIATYHLDLQRIHA